ncbi:GNAT family N-acetyltransferase [Mycobacterium sp.]|uniref:GNAT family N-acetyltransferase n=1 Tax=Mycobacterium sp. TaxID=1785 RepID=UPI003BAED8F2
MAISGGVDGVYTATLRDGATLSLRQLGSSDIDAVAALHGTLSERELYLRFFTTHPVSFNVLADKLTEHDGRHYALGAFESGKLIGIANYAKCGKPATADVAAVVAHKDHLRGVGTVLLRRLAHIARNNGIRHLVADILATNSAMFSVLHDAGLHPQHKNYACGVVHLDIDLNEPSSD